MAEDSAIALRDRGDAALDRIEKYAESPFREVLDVLRPVLRPESVWDADFCATRDVAVGGLEESPQLTDAERAKLLFVVEDDTPVEAEQQPTESK